MAEDLNSSGDNPPPPPDPPPPPKPPEQPEVDAKPNPRSEQLGGSAPPDSPPPDPPPPPTPPEQPDQPEVKESGDDPGPGAKEAPDQPNGSDPDGHAAPPDKASSGQDDAMKAADADLASAMETADRDFADAMRAADADLAESLGRPVDPVSDSESPVPEHTLQPEPRTSPGEGEPAKAGAGPADGHDGTPPADQPLLKGAFPPADQPLIEEPATPREVAASGMRGAASAMDKVADNAGSIATAADVLRRMPQAPDGIQFDRGLLEANLRTVPTVAANRLEGAAERLEKGDPADLGQGPLIRGGAPGVDVAREPDPRADPRPPEDGRRLIIGKLDDLRYQSDRRNLADPLAEPQRMPDVGSTRANYDQNDRELRWEMGRGLPIQDVSHDIDTGELLHDTGFLKAERDILRDHGWQYHPDAREWRPPDDWDERRDRNPR
jgi:hypothetical protein